MADLKFLAQEWPAISRRLDEALAIEPGQRDTWLDSLAEPDSIRAKLRHLLSTVAGVETGDFLEALPKLTLGPGPMAEASPADTASAGMAIGPYRLIRELGVGGMGLVWLAERSDGGLKRLVALKLPRLSWSRGLAERMSRERDILASLDHPNIARIYDAGLDGQGRPYLALEYVEGEAIDVYCRNRSLSVTGRLALVLQVARAVAHAHARLVVHRDLKPANILVNAEGQVRLLDFGIAKLLEGELTQETQLTQQGGRAMTPDYASPEQIRGEPLGTASDVYSLAVVTYQLLAGASPYTLKRHSAAALEEAIASIDPPLASAASADKAVSRELAGDLDAVLNKALKKNPAERYATVDALIADIECHLSHRPVQAQPDRWGYRTGKFLRRHRVPVALGSAAALALVVGVSVALWQAQAASRQRDRALTLLSRNEAVNEFLGLFITESSQSDRPMKLADMLERSEAMAEKQFRDAPEDRAVVLAMLGMYHDSLGGVTKAEALLKRALASARDSSDASLKARLKCQYATILQELGSIDEARRDLQATAQRSDIDAETAVECFAYLSYVSRALNDGPGAVANTERALERLRASQRPSLVAQATLVGDLASGLQLSGRNEEAERQFGAALQMFARLGREASAEAITVRNNWGQVSLGAGDARAALVRFDEILALRGTTGGGELAYHEMASRASALQMLGRYSDAAGAFALALAAAKRGGHATMQAYCLLGLGSVAREIGDLQGAQSYLVQVERMAASARPEGSPEAAAEHILRARIAFSRGDSTLARREFTRLLVDRQPNASTVNALIGRAEVALHDGHLELASVDAQDALRLAQSLQGGTSHSVRTGLAWLVEGEIRARSGAAPAARDAFASALTHLTQTVDASHPALKRAQTLLAEAAPPYATR